MGPTMVPFREPPPAAFAYSRHPAAKGPVEARNIVAQAAKGEIVFFLDADVCVHADGVIGSYDDDPSSRDFLSQYKNLMHCFVHQNAESEASTFWSGCGADD
jgi:hypothetical protein